MFPSEIPEPAHSSAMGFHAVLMRIHDPFLASIFWLALGCVLWGPDEACVVPRLPEHGREEPWLSLSSSVDLCACVDAVS